MIKKYQIKLLALVIKYINFYIINNNLLIIKMYNITIFYNNCNSLDNLNRKINNYLNNKNFI